MYSITEVLLMQSICFIILYNSETISKKLRISLYNLFNNINAKFIFLVNFYQFVCKHNPVLLDYYDYDEAEDEVGKCAENDKVDDVKINVKAVVPVKYEDKYLDRFKEFPNEFKFTNLELEQENKNFTNIKKTLTTESLDKIKTIKDKLFLIDAICQKGEVRNIDKDELSQRVTAKYEDKLTWDGPLLTKNINTFGKVWLSKYFDMEDEFRTNQDICYEELYMSLLIDKEKLEDELQEVEKVVFTNDEIQLKARQMIVKERLDNYINNYIIEHTPLGNVFMRYNNDKGSFEYFSNNTIPYRYLEPIGRRYVMTYWCKPIFVDIEEELKNAEIKFDLKKEEDEKKKLEIKNNPKDLMVRLKSYNKETKNQATTNPQMKNRSSNNVLPPQIKANLPNVNQSSEKQLLKEHANRYTWEGRLSSFCPLKKISKKILDKNLTMSYAEFKRMQHEDKNKKYV